MSHITALQGQTIKWDLANKSLKTASQLLQCHKNNLTHLSLHEDTFLGLDWYLLIAMNLSELTSIVNMLPKDTVSIVCLIGNLGWGTLSSLCLIGKQSHSFLEPCFFFVLFFFFIFVADLTWRVHTSHPTPVI